MIKELLEAEPGAKCECFRQRFTLLSTRLVKAVLGGAFTLSGLTAVAHILRAPRIPIPLLFDPRPPTLNVGRCKSESDKRGEKLVEDFGRD